MLAVARRLLRDEQEAQDAVQDAFLSAFKKIDTFDGRSRLSTWLHRIAVNAALMRLRRRARLGERSIEDLLPRFKDDGHRLSVGPPWQPTPDVLAQTDEMRRLVHESIAKLPEDYRNVILLRDIEELGTQQAADVLGIRPGAVKTRLHRARLALRELLDPHVRKEGA